MQDRLHDGARLGRGRWAVGLFALALAVGSAAAAEDDAASDLRAFVAGDYALVGREPEGGPAYAGTAKIAEDGEQLILERQIGGRTVRAIGRVEVPSPHGEGQLLRFHWTDGQAMTMTCLVAGDLDNYAR